MADPVQTPPTRKESDDFFDHIKKFFSSGAKGDTKEITEKGGPGGQMREKSIMDAVDDAVNGAKDDPI